MGNNATISSLMILVLVISLVASVFALTMGNLNQSYDTDINETQLEAYNKLTNISTNAENVKSDIEELNEESGLFDVIGAYFAAGYKSFRVSTQSFDAMEEVVSQSVDDSPIGDSETIDTVRVAMITMLLIVVFITIGLSIIFKWNV